MTSIVAWAGVDSRRVGTIYIASDSRISWGRYQWDQGRKVFACRKAPHIFGYWGDVLFPALALPVLVERIDSIAASASDASVVDLEQAVRPLWEDYPRAGRRGVGILHAFSRGDATNSKIA